MNVQDETDCKCTHYFLRVFHKTHMRKPASMEHRQRTNVYTFIDVSMYVTFYRRKVEYIGGESEYWKPMKRNLDIQLDSGLNPSLIISPRIESREFVRSCISTIYEAREPVVYGDRPSGTHRTDRLIIASYLFYLRVCARARARARTHCCPSHTHTEERARP